VFLDFQYRIFTIPVFLLLSASKGTPNSYALVSGCYIHLIQWLSLCTVDSSTAVKMAQRAPLR